MNHIIRKNIFNTRKFKQRQPVRDPREQKQLGTVVGYANDGSVIVRLPDGTTTYLMEGLLEPYEEEK